MKGMDTGKIAMLRKVLNIVSSHRSGNCCGVGLSGTGVGGNPTRKIVIVGSPNVGKSVVFNRLTGAHVTVSNYPGTTVIVTRGKMKAGAEEFEVVDTPGMYSLLPLSEEERVARSILLEERPDVILHVVDAKNLARMLPLTLQLIEAGLPTMLDLNMMDETEAAGIQIDLINLEKALGLPIVATVGTTGQGMGELRRRLAEYGNNQHDTAEV